MTVERDGGSQGSAKRRASEKLNGTHEKRTRVGAADGEEHEKAAAVAAGRSSMHGMTMGGQPEYVPTRTKEEVAALLSKTACPSLASSREGPGRKQVVYLAIHDAIVLANYIFGYDGWRFQPVETGLLCKEVQGGRCSISWRTLGRVTLARHLGDISREDYGYGNSTETSEGASVMKAGKQSVSDALKRALMQFGGPFNDFKNPKFLQWSAGLGKTGSLPRRVFTVDGSVNPWEGQSGHPVQVAHRQVDVVKVEVDGEDEEYGDLESDYSE
jgi:DNA recombination protein Rad52